jgi:hypothetical protein
MNLYIEVENGLPKNHPAFEDNLIQAFGSVPTQWELFSRVELPTLGAYELMISDEPKYQKINGVWVDVLHKRDMTDEEKTAKKEAVVTAFNSREYAENWSAWTLDEVNCKMTPPIPRPEPVTGKDIRWCGADNNWKELPTRPDDINQYKFDFLAWEWVQIL